MSGDEAVKSEEAPKTEVDVTDLDKKIIRQVEYYFGNFNLKKDKFLKEEIKKDDGWISLTTLITFQRLKALSEDFKVICDALKKSTSDLLEIDEENHKIRRNVNKPLSDEPIDNEALEARSLYVKGFKKTTTLDQLLDFFRPHNSEYIMMRRFPKDKQFKGSVFVLFLTQEDADKFLELKGIKYENTELLKEKKKDYLKRKEEEYLQRKQEKELKAAGKKAGEQKDKSQKSAPAMIPGALLKLTGLKEDITREDIQEVLRDCAAIAYYGYNRGQDTAIIRFETGDAAVAIEKVAKEEDGQKVVEIKTSKAVMSVIEGDEEKEFWDKYAERRANMGHFKGGKPGRGRFNNKFRGKREGKRGHSDDPPAKKMKSENGTAVEST